VASEPSTPYNVPGREISTPGIPALLSDNLRKKKIPKLDALRAISALIVVLYHFGFAFLPAGAGVMIFFVISGFLITWLLLEEFDKTGRIALGHFYFRRTFRIFPAFYVFWAVSVGGLLVKRGHIIWGQVVATFFYVGNYYQGLNHYPETGFSHAWSLGVEEQYYLLWPALVLLLAGNSQRLLRATGWGILLVWIYRDVLQLAGAPEEYIYTAFDTRIDHLLVGCMLAISLRYGYFARFWTIVCARTGYMLVPFGGLILSITAQWFWGVNYRNTVGFMVDPILVAVLMAQLLASRDRWLAWMDSAPLVYLGTISYSTYLYHEMAARIVVKAAGGLPPVVSIIAGVAVTYAAASISYYGVERPFLRLRGRIESRHRLARATTPYAG
jgi:peptidoglycan/LPS O-acetylase OafA/YrhL